jgi:TonB family protein
MTLVLWMLRSVLVSLLVGVAALASERVLRALGRQGRWSWAIALGTLTLWIPASPLLARAALPASIADRLPALPIASSTAFAPGSLSLDLARWVALLWALASSILAVRLAFHMRDLRALRALTRRATVDGGPVLIDDCIGPATIGIGRPEVIIPALVLQLDSLLRDLVLRHEREHCIARDPSLLLAAQLTLVLYPWNAALWWFARRLSLAVELDCDARVIRADGDRIRYAQLLLLFAQRGVTHRLAPALAMFPSHLARRVLAMQGQPRTPRRITLVVTAGSCILAVIAACSASLIESPKTAASPAPHAAAARSDSQCPGCFEFKLDEAARPLPEAGWPTYPADMRAAKREGEVLARFVVNGDGTVDPSTLQIVRSTDEAFTAAVRDAMHLLRFSPARVGGRAVRQLVEQPFTFALAKESRN